MKTNLKLILSCVGVVALLASPVMAKQVRVDKAASVAVPSDARASIAAINEGGPYTPSASTQPYGKNRDFQGGFNY